MMICLTTATAYITSQKALSNFFITIMVTLIDLLMLDLRGVQGLLFEKVEPFTLRNCTDQTLFLIAFLTVWF